MQEIFGVEFRSVSPLVGRVEDLTEHYKRELRGCVFDRIIVCSSYAGKVEESIYRFKYDRIREESELLAPLLFDALEYLDLKTGGSEGYLFTWIPIWAVRLLARWFNQWAVLVKLIAKAQGREYRKCLSRFRSWKHQARLSVAERLANAGWRFSPAFGLSKSLHGRHVVLVDDVISTGTTANECAKVLKKHGAKSVTGIFLARSG